MMTPHHARVLAHIQRSGGWHTAVQVRKNVKASHYLTSQALAALSESGALRVAMVHGNPQYCADGSPVPTTLVDHVATVLATGGWWSLQQILERVGHARVSVSTALRTLVDSGRARASVPDTKGSRGLLWTSDMDSATPDTRSRISVVYEMIRDHQPTTAQIMATTGAKDGHHDAALRRLANTGFVELVRIGRKAAWRWRVTGKPWVGRCVAYVPHATRLRTSPVRRCQSPGCAMTPDGASRWCSRCTRLREQWVGPREVEL